MTNKNNWDIFCRVIDNFGDIGVCWRLAKVLQNEYHINVRLWLDDLSALKTIETEINPTAKQQVFANITINVWSENMPFPENYISDVVIEAFACSPPAEFFKKLSNKNLILINLEYLSAEKWVEDCHGLPSPNNDNIFENININKYFFFPGFTAKTGGVIIEKNIHSQNNSFNKQQGRVYLNKAFNINISLDEQIIFYFAYQNEALPTLLETLITQQTSTTFLVPLINSQQIDSANKQLQEILNLGKMNIGDKFVFGSLTILIIPFVSQNDFDKLLRACDVLFVRGEDSFVRAQLTGKPFVWSIYPQAGNHHIVKLQAFLELYNPPSSAHYCEGYNEFLLNWNNEKITPKLWQNFINSMHIQDKINLKWQNNLQNIGSLEKNLMEFINKVNLMSLS